MDLLKIQFDTSTVFGIVAITCISVLVVILFGCLTKFMFNYSERVLMKKTFKTPLRISALRPGYFVVHDIQDNKFLVSIAVVGQKQIICDPEINGYAPAKQEWPAPDGWYKIGVAYTIGDKFWIDTCFSAKKGTLLLKVNKVMIVVDQKRDVIWDKNIPGYVKWK